VVTTGVTDVGSIVVAIEPPNTVTVLVPDRYHLQLTLSVPISIHAESVRFKRRTGKLAMLCSVVSTTEGPAAAEAEHEQLQDDAEAAAEPMHQSAAGATLEQECAEPGSGAVDHQQQQEQHADPAAAAAKSGGQMVPSKPMDPKGAAAACIRCGQQAGVVQGNSRGGMGPAYEGNQSK
jgi:hypothetical protein